MAQPIIRYTIWRDIEIPVGRMATDFALDDWLKHVVMQLGEPVIVGRIRAAGFGMRRRYELVKERIEDKRDVRRARNISYRDRIPPWLIVAPRLQEELLEPNYRPTESGTLDLQNAGKVLDVPRYAAACVLDHLLACRAIALVGHDADWITTFKYE